MVSGVGRLSPAGTDVYRAGPTAPPARCSGARSAAVRVVARRTCERQDDERRSAPHPSRHGGQRYTRRSSGVNASPGHAWLVVESTQ